jgi:hypothetical protein
MVDPDPTPDAERRPLLGTAARRVEIIRAHTARHLAASDLTCRRAHAVLASAMVALDRSNTLLRSGAQHRVTHERTIPEDCADGDAFPHVDATTPRG